MFDLAMCFSHFSLLKRHVSEQALCLDGSHGGPWGGVGICCIGAGANEVIN